MHYTTIDTFSVTLPITYFRKVVRTDAPIIFARMLGIVPREHVNDLTKGDFISWQEKLSDVLPVDLWGCLLQQFLFDLTGQVIPVDDHVYAGRNSFRNMMKFAGGFVCWGGNNVVFQRDGLPSIRPERVQVYFDATGCEQYLRGSANKRLAAMIKRHAGRITRCDIALDLLDGEQTIGDVLNAYECDLFTYSQRPKAKHIKELGGHGDGETVYIGVRGNGKLLRAYEKGKQLGNPDSVWLRIEVELGSKDREIDPRILVAPDRAFAQAYPYCREVLRLCRDYQGDPDASRLVRITKTKHDTIVTFLIRHAQRGYGALVNYLADLGMDAGQIVQALIREGVHPRRIVALSPSSRRNHRLVDA